jgi:predicted O-methyltransferase YrrM
MKNEQRPRTIQDLHWQDNATFVIGGESITLDYELGGSKRKSDASDFTMMKTRGFLDHYLQHSEEDFTRILEIGVYQGGSYVFLDQLFRPRKITAVELSQQPIPALDDYVFRNRDRAQLRYGVSQDDATKLAGIIETDLGGEIDLVVDDASHFYDQTKASFRVAFPKVRPGGLYIIEDWSWSFQAPFQTPDHPWREAHSLANLVVDLMEEMALQSLIDEISVTPHMMKIRRSSAPAAPVFTSTARRGRRYQPI